MVYSTSYIYRHVGYSTSTSGQLEEDLGIKNTKEVNSNLNYIFDAHQK